MSRYCMIRALAVATVIVGGAACRAAAEEAIAPPPAPEQAAPAAPRSVLPDRRYVWFVYPEAHLLHPKLQVWRVESEGLSWQAFNMPGGADERVHAYDAYGDWIWLLTNRGVRRIGRLRPVEGKSDRFEPDLVNPEVIGPEPVGIVIADSRIVVASGRGLLVFDRHRRQLSSLTDHPVKKLKRSPFGIIARTPEGLFVLDTSFGDVRLAPLTLEQGTNWQEQVSPEAYVLAEPDGSGVIAIVDAAASLSFGLDQLQVNLAAGEQLREACQYGGRLWLLTTTRLAAIAPGPASDVQYDLSDIEVSNPELVVQAGMLRCGPIAVRVEGERFGAHVVSLRPGDPAPVQAESLSVTDARRITQ